jgi:predicted nucleic acid-binding protein
MFLLDTMILSELRKRRRDRQLVAWLEDARPVDLHLSVVTIGEVEKGIAKQRRLDPTFASRLATWLDSVLRHYESRILPVDIDVARRWGQLADAHSHAGADLLIAATALEHGLTVVTRNVRHFASTGVPLLDPSELASH